MGGPLDGPVIVKVAPAPGAPVPADLAAVLSDDLARDRQAEARACGLVVKN